MIFMKVKEYFAKYLPTIKASLDIPEATDRVIYGIYQEMSLEVKTLCEKRNAQKPEALCSVIREINQKWNSLAFLFEKELGFPIMQRDGLKTVILNHVPELKQFMK